MLLKRFGLKNYLSSALHVIAISNSMPYVRYLTLDLSYYRQSFDIGKVELENIISLKQ